METPLWLIPARAKAGSKLPMNASTAEIDAAADKAARGIYSVAKEFGYELVMPTARIIVETTTDGDTGEDVLQVGAWSQATLVTP